MRNKILGIIWGFNVGILLGVFVLTSCSYTRSVMVIDSLGGGYFHVVGMNDDYSDVIKLPDGINDGDIIRIKLKKKE